MDVKIGPPMEGALGLAHLWSERKQGSSLRNRPARARLQRPVRADHLLAGAPDPCDAQNVVADACGLTGKFSNGPARAATEDGALVGVPDDVTGPAWLIDRAKHVTDLDTIPGVDLLPKSGQLQILIDCTLWRYPEPRFTSVALARAMQDLGRRLIEPGLRGLPKADQMAYDTVRLRARFPTTDSAIRQKLAHLETGLAALLPATRCTQVDLQTGLTLAHPVLPLDPELAAWCQAGPDRWLSVSRPVPAGPWLGLRPVAA